MKLHRITRRGLYQGEDRDSDAEERECGMEQAPDDECSHRVLSGPAVRSSPLTATPTCVR